MIEFDLPDELIAQAPVNPRDAAKLLVYDRATGEITDATFRDLDDYLPSNTTLVLNNTKVDHCRLLFNGGKTEIFILQKLDDRRVVAKVRPGRKFKPGTAVDLTDELSATVQVIDDDGLYTLEFNVPHDDPLVKKYEHVPLPPYIAQNDDLADQYQTVYAEESGSKAAPTAGLHITDELLNQLRGAHEIAEVTLNVGLGTFAPLKQSNIESGTLHAETYTISDDNRSLIESAEHITAVGTTTTRTLESWASTGEASGSTDIFIQPGYSFKQVDALITNFHLPSTSLLLMIEALIGSEQETQKIYDHAIANKYRFYSFGDAMLIL